MHFLVASSLSTLVVSYDLSCSYSFSSVTSVPACHVQESLNFIRSERRGGSTQKCPLIRVMAPIQCFLI
jgi:hypothetical protein